MGPRGRVDALRTIVIQAKVRALSQRMNQEIIPAIDDQVIIIISIYSNTHFPPNGELFVTTMLTINVVVGQVIFVLPTFVLTRLPKEIVKVFFF